MPEKYIALSKVITAGMKVIIDFMSHVNSEKEMYTPFLTLNTVVEEIIDDESLLIHMPTYKGDYYKMAKSDLIYLRFMTKTDLYSVQLKYDRRVLQGSLLLAKVYLDGPIRSTQARGFYRLPHALSVTVGYLDQDEEEQSYEARTVDISAGGMLLASAERLENGANITLTFDIGSPVTLNGTALRVTTSDSPAYRFRIAVRFEDLHEQMQSRISMFVMRKQMDQRKRIGDI
ncbi:MAG: flagellar brake protein [Oscillospiraceae bacterium]|nr:flagellar brake protein [Oscillospiraceae bacterium]